MPRPTASTGTIAGTGASVVGVATVVATVVGAGVAGAAVVGTGVGTKPVELPVLYAVLLPYWFDTVRVTL